MLKKNKELQELLTYVRKDILEYGKGKKTPPCLKKKIENLAYENEEQIYTYEMIKYSFMLNSEKIKYALSHKEFANEQHKINYIMVIVANSMNDIQKRVRDAEISNLKKELDVEQANYLSQNDLLNGSQRYVKKTKELNEERIKDLW